MKTLSRPRKKAKGPRHFTLMVVPHSRDKIWSIRVPASLVKALSILLLLAMVALGSFTYAYHNLLQNMDELRYLRATSREQKDQIDNLKKETSNIQEKLIILDQLDAQIRAKLNLPKPAPSRGPESGRAQGGEQTSSTTTLPKPSPGSQGEVRIASALLPPAVEPADKQGPGPANPSTTADVDVEVAQPGTSPGVATTSPPLARNDYATARRLAPVSRSDGRTARSSQELAALGATVASLHEEVKEKQEVLTQLSQAVDQKIAKDAATPTGWPARGEITSTFGYRRSPFGWGSDFHPAIDIAAAWGTPVAATANGIVRYVGWKGGLGRTVILEHGYGFTTLYGHLTQATVKAGQKVQRGQVIGLMGSTGLSTGPHVHYEVWVAGKQVDPWPYMQRKLP